MGRHESYPRKERGLLVHASGSIEDEKAIRLSVPGALTLQVINYPSRATTTSLDRETLGLYWSVQAALATGLLN